MQILASGATPGLLQPGESVTIPVYYAGWITTLPNWQYFSPYSFNLGVLQADNTTAVDWASMGPSLQPPSIPTAAWTTIFANLTANMGSTWGSVVQKMDQDAAYLGYLGEKVTDLSQLWSFEVQQAIGISPVQTLSNATDMTVPTPGLPLHRPKLFFQHRRPQHPWAIRLRLGAGGRMGPDAGRRFQRQRDHHRFGQCPPHLPAGFVLQCGDRRAYAAQPGDYGVLTSPSSGVYLLTEQDGQVTEFQNGQVAFIEDADGNKMTAGYTSGMLSSLTDSSGASIQLGYNAAGRITTLTNSLGQTTTFAYDPTNKYLLSVADYDGYTTSYTYHTGANSALSNALLTITNPDGTQQDFSYDAEGRLSQTSENNGAQAIQYTYGIAGTVAATDAADDTTTYYFDYRGQLAKLVDPLGNATFYTYDPNGNLIQVTDPAGEVYSYQYDSKGNMSQSTDPLGDVTKFAYGSLDTLSSVTDPNGNTTQYQHDQNGNLQLPRFTPTGPPNRTPTTQSAKFCNRRTATKTSSTMRTTSAGSSSPRAMPTAHKRFTLMIPSAT